MRLVRRGAVAALLLALAATSAAATPTGAAPARDGHRGDGAGPDRIGLPDGWRPEGITTDGRRLYTGSLANGAIWVADPRTGAGRVLAEGAPGRVAVGVEYDARRDLLWVAGGETGEVRAQDADTGQVRATYSFPSPDSTARFLNDLVVTRGAVYVTDSRHAELAVIPLAHRRALPRPSAARLLPLTGDLQMQPGNNLNGIVETRLGLVAVQSNAGALFRIGRHTGRTTAIDLGGETLVNGDGLEVGHGRLYVVRNRNNLIAVVHLRTGRSPGSPSGTVERTLTDPALDVPSTAALVGHSLYAVNARFTTPPTPTTAYQIIRVDVRPPG